MSDVHPVLSQTLSPETRVTHPVVIDRGKQPRSQISQLKRGESGLWVEVADAVQHVVAQLGPEKKNKRKRSGLASPFGA